MIQKTLYKSFCGIWVGVDGDYSFLEKCLNNSMGMGNMMVLFFSAEMLVSVCRYLSCRVTGLADMTSAAFCKIPIKTVIRFWKTNLHRVKPPTLFVLPRRRSLWSEPRASPPPPTPSLAASKRARKRLWVRLAPLWFLCFVEIRNQIKDFISMLFSYPIGP